MFRVGIFGATILLWIFYELALRAKYQQHPQNFRELLKYSQKRTSPHPLTWPPLVFSLLTFLIFAFWEGFLRALLEQRLSNFVSIAGAFFLAYFFYRRLKLWSQTRNENSFTKVDLFSLVAGVALFLPALCTLVLGPWLYLRSRHLKPS